MQTALRSIDGGLATKKKSAKKRRRVRHPGVVLIKPNEARRSGWMARYRDPDSGKVKQVTLPADHTTLEQREQWAVDKSKDLANRAHQLEAGAPRATGTTLTAAVKRYFDAHPQLRKRTKRVYRDAADKLEAWAAQHRITSADDLTRAKLLAFRETLIAEPKKTAEQGGKRGASRGREETRAPATVNRELRAVRTVLGYVRDLDLLPRVTADDLQRALKQLPGNSERISFMKPAEITQTLQAALKHDAERFTETRDEHSGEGRKRIGTTPRYDAIAPFVAFVLLTGCRFAEALQLEWEHIDLDALDHDGKPAGEIHLTAAATKTHRARTIGLEVSPALRRMLATMQPKDVSGSVFGLTRRTAEAAAKRLRADYGAPASFGWQMLRRTCGTYLTNAPGIFGAASAYRSAKQLGHSVAVAEKHYVGLVRGIPSSATSLDEALNVSDTVKTLAHASRVTFGE